MAGLGVGLGADERDMHLVMIFKKRHDFDGKTYQLTQAGLSIEATIDGTNF